MLESIDCMHLGSKKFPQKWHGMFKKLPQNMLKKLPQFCLNFFPKDVEERHLGIVKTCMQHI